MRLANCVIALGGVQESELSDSRLWIHIICSSMEAGALMPHRLRLSIASASACLSLYLSLHVYAFVSLPLSLSHYVCLCVSISPSPKMET